MLSDNKLILYCIRIRTFVNYNNICNFTYLSSDMPHSNHVDVIKEKMLAERPGKKVRGALPRPWIFDTMQDEDIKKIVKVLNTTNNCTAFNKMKFYCDGPKADNKGNRRTRCVLLNISSLLEINITNCDLI